MSTTRLLMFLRTVFHRSAVEDRLYSLRMRWRMADDVATPAVWYPLGIWYSGDWEGFTQMVECFV